VGFLTLPLFLSLSLAFDFALVPHFCHLLAEVGLLTLLLFLLLCLSFDFVPAPALALAVDRRPRISASPGAIIPR
jgi:hypothetical protein